MLNVFISWSGSLSQDSATLFYEFLPELLPNTKPWMSTEDIPKGKGWFASILSQMGKSPVCVICVTKHNIQSSWIYFEAGGLTFAMNDPRICAYLIDVAPNEVAGTPLGQIQCTIFNKKDTWRLVRDINLAMSLPHDEVLLKGNFENKWPAFKEKMESLVNEHHVPEEHPPANSISELSNEAKQLLIEASQSDDGGILAILSSGGFEVQSNAKNLCATKDPKLESLWRKAVTQLTAREFIEDRGGKGELFWVTAEGYAMADILRTSQEALRPVPEPNFDDNDLQNMLHGWFNKQPFNAETETINFACVDAELKLPPGSTKRHIEAVAKKHNYMAESKGENTILIKFVARQTGAPVMSNPGWDNPNNPFGRRRK